MIKVLHFPDARKGNPYQQLLAEGLEKNSVNVNFKKGFRQLFYIAIKERPDIVHFHWIHGNLLGSNIIKTLLKSLRFLITIIIIKSKGVRIFWTVHNLKNHENKQIGLELFFTKIFTNLVDVVLVHGKSAIISVQKTFYINKEKIHVIPHGNYDGCFRFKNNKEEIRKKKDISYNTKVFLYFGMIRPYKGVPELIKSFYEVEGNVKLIIAGSPRDESLKDEIEHLASLDSRIDLNLWFVSEDELSELLELSDVVVLPYKDIFTSGSLLLALTFGKPVIAPHVGLIPEYVDDLCAFLYSQDFQNGLYEALNNASKSEMLEEMGYYARRKADYYNWENISKELVELYHNSIKNR